MFASDSWDMIVIKIHGRADSSSPSIIMFDCVSQQEVIYVENTALPRLMTPTQRHPNHDALMDKARYVRLNLNFKLIYS